MPCASYLEPLVAALKHLRGTVKSALIAPRSCRLCTPLRAHASPCSTFAWYGMQSEHCRQHSSMAGRHLHQSLLLLLLLLLLLPESMAPPNLNSCTSLAFPPCCSR